MKDLKIRVNSESESKEVQELFFELGGKWHAGGCDIKYTNGPYFYLENGLVLYGYSAEAFLTEKHKEITLPQLRDLVVLKRNKNTDATHIDSNNYDWYVASDEKHYRHQGDIWVYQPCVDCLDLKPIEKPMKEYLDPKHNYELCLSDEDLTKEGMIKIPEKWMNFVYKLPDGDIRFSDNLVSTIADHIIWQRHTHPEELPFIDDEPLQSLNDQYAEIEKVRQSHRTASETEDPTIKETLSQRQAQYGDFKDVADTTERLFKTIKDGNSFDDFTNDQRMALYMICSKMARIVNGNPNHKDSWHDIAGYATLIDNELESEKDMPF